MQATVKVTEYGKPVKNHKNTFFDILKTTTKELQKGIELAIYKGLGRESALNPIH